MEYETLDLFYDDGNNLNKTTIRRVDEITDGANIIDSYTLIKNCII